MRNKAFLCALMLAAASMTATACSDSSSESEVKDDIQYFLACQTPVSCTLSIEEGVTGNVSMLVSSYNKTTMESMFVNGVTVQATKNGTAFTLMDGAADTASMATDAKGIATFSITAAAAGNGTIQMITDEAHATNPVTVTVIVTPKQQEVVAKDYNYTVGLSYSGIQKLNVANAMVYPGKKCSEIIKSGMLTSELNALTGYAKDATDVYPDYNVAAKKMSFTFSETDVVSYAVVARAMSGGKYTAYGCTDNMNRDNANIIVALSDAQIEDVKPEVDCDKTPNDPACVTPEVDCDKTPNDPACKEEPPVEPEIPDITYAGTYTLTSQFDALSLLPSASKNGEQPLFKDMLAGDWVKFALKFLSDPEGTLPDILTQQLLPLILDAEWFRNLLAKIPTYGPIIVGLLDTLEIDDLLEQFGVKKIIEDYLTQLTSQITWWGDATGGIQIANELATNFTLYGNFKIATEAPNDKGQIAGNGHNYQSLLYHNGTFEKCLIGTEFGTDANKKTICEIPISSLDANSTVRGTFTAQFSEVADGTGTANVMSHSLNLAYGKLIYAAIMQIVPTFIKVEDGVKLQTLSDILVYYVGMGAVNLYNKQHEDDMISGKYGCDAVGEVLYKLLAGLLKNSDGDTTAIGQLISTFVQSSMLSSLCQTGITALDNLIDTQLDRLSVSSDKVMFSSEACHVDYAKNKDGYPTKLADFGQADYVWGMDSKLDKRCTWDVSIQTGSSEDETPKTNTVKGKYFAVAKGK